MLKAFHPAHIRNSRVRWLLIKKLIIFIGAIFLTCSSFANPVLGNIASGQVSIQQGSNTTTINQSSSQAIINWQSFNIGANQATRFQQPAGGVTLNRINPTQGPSSILGMLSATGQIILINPAGIYFGSSAVVNVGGLIATTANITDANFLSHNYQFLNAGPGSIVNAGQLIAADHGLIALVGSNVTNNGLIKADLGHVILASGSAFTINFAGNDLINFSVGGTAGRVTNTGSLIANGGEIMISAAAAQNVLDNVIDMRGIAEAKSVYQQNGEIIISGSPGSGTVNVSGKLNASSHYKNQAGGTIDVSGYDVLLSSATLDVSGEAGGGHIQIGRASDGTLSNETIIAPNVNLLAEAYKSGNGGYIETSGNYLDVNGINVNTTAANGSTGTWLLDPTNIYIAANQADATTAGMTGTDNSASTGSGSNPETFVGTGAIQDSLLTTGSLTTALGTTSVVVSTANASGTGAGNITVVDPFGWSNGSSLTLTAANNIALNAAITTGTAASTLILNAANAVTQTAAIGGAGAVEQNGAGTVTLSQANTYTGGTIINTGTLNAANNAALGTGAVTVANGATFGMSGTAINVGNNITFNSGSTLSEANAFGGNILSGTLSMNGTVGISVTSASNDVLNLNGLISGTGITLNKSGVGTLVLGGANTFTGTTNITAGTLVVANDAALGSSAAVFSAGTGLSLSGTSLDVANNLTFGSGDTIAENNANGNNTLSGAFSMSGTQAINVSNATNDKLTLSGDISGTGITLNKGGVGTLVLSGTNAFTGTTNDSAGIINLQSNTALGASSATAVVSSGAELSLTGTALNIPNAISIVGTGVSNAGVIVDTTSGGNNILSGGITLTGASTIAVSNSNDTLNLSGIITDSTNSFSLTKIGAGTLELSNANTYDGGTTISSGILAVANSTGLGTGTATVSNGAELAINGSGLNIGNAINITGTGISNAGALTDISSGASNTVSGTVTMGANSDIGVTNSDDNLTISGLLTGPFSMTKVGVGTLTLTHANTYTGGTTVSAGTLAAGNATAFNTQAATVNAGSTLANQQWYFYR